jgi:V/A-type H+-transporting ATPase subunit F|tara:strand:+ start:1419 stop:1718 length:300 start_codon:yes stop_codon:yes gene_type:complete
MKIVAIGGRPFVTGLQLAGVEGKEVSTPQEALVIVKDLMVTPNIGLIILSDDIEKIIRNEISEIRLNQPVPIIYAVPAPGGTQEKVQYREIVKQMLKIG